MPNVKINPVTGLCDPDPVTIRGANQTITFLIDPAAGNTWNWNNTTPLVIKKADGTAAPAGCFTIPTPSAARAIVVQDRNSVADKGTYKYTAMLIKDGAANPVTIDPSIQNES